MNIFEAKKLVDQVVGRNFSRQKADISDLVRGLTVDQQQAMHQLNASLNSYRNIRRREVFRELKLHSMEYAQVLAKSRIKIGAAFTVLGLGVTYILTKNLYASAFAGIAFGLLVSSVEKETRIFASFLDDYPIPTHVKGSWYHVQKNKINTIKALISPH